MEVIASVIQRSKEAQKSFAVHVYAEISIVVHNLRLNESINVTVNTTINRSNMKQCRISAMTSSCYIIPKPSLTGFTSL